MFYCNTLVRDKDSNGGGGGAQDTSTTSGDEGSTLNVSITASKKKRRELSTNATKTINKHKFTVVLDFD